MELKHTPRGGRGVRVTTTNRTIMELKHTPRGGRGVRVTTTNRTIMELKRRKQIATSFPYAY